MQNKLCFSLLVLCLMLNSMNAQKHIRDTVYSNHYEKFSGKKLIVPGILIGYGLISYDSPWGIRINKDLNKKIAGNRPLKVDDFTAMIPGISVLAIDFISHDARHNFKDRTFLLAIGAALNNGTTFALKNITNEKRPMEDKYNSFPSGHTSNAFLGAEFLRLEYGQASVWYPIVGYSMAIATAYMRMYNNKHWFSDVVAGAGIGILSMNAAYWIYPWLQRVFSGKKKGDFNALLFPGYDGQHAQMGILLQF